MPGFESLLDDTFMAEHALACHVCDCDTGCDCFSCECDCVKEALGD